MQTRPAQTARRGPPLSNWEVARPVRAAFGSSCFIGNGSQVFTEAALFQTDTLEPLCDLATADLNGDGTQDYIGTSEVGVVVGLGISNISSEPALIYTGGGCAPLQVGDLNNDGALDIAVLGTIGALGGFTQLSILFGDGAGGFPQQTVQSIGLFDDFILEDVDGDGSLDVVGHFGSAIRTYLNDGSGAFTLVPPFIMSGVVSIQAADFDQDGNGDILALSGTSGQVGLFLGDGTGGFSNASNFTVNINGDVLRTGDFNGDGQPDAVVMSASGNSLQVLINGDSVSFRRGDTNNDGNIDIADGISLLQSLFLPNTSPLVCPDAGDANDDGVLNVADPIALLGFVFGQSGPLPSAGATCGLDLTLDPLGCGANACP